jgi:hypothetical protein
MVRIFLLQIKIEKRAWKDWGYRSCFGPATWSITSLGNFQPWLKPRTDLAIFPWQVFSARLYEKKWQFFLAKESCSKLLMPAFAQGKFVKCASGKQKATLTWNECLTTFRAQSNKKLSSRAVATGWGGGGGGGIRYVWLKIQVTIVSEIREELALNIRFSLIVV